MKEIIDQFDENGNYIGVVEKDIAHRDGLWHKSVHVWIVNNKNEILLQYRCAKKKFFPNVWDVSFAGHVGAGEDTITAAIREAKEELGIDVDKNKLEFLFTNKEKLKYDLIQSNEFVDVYLLREDIKIESLKYQESEVSLSKYVNILDFFKAVNNEKENILPHPIEYKLLEEILIER